MIGLSCPKPQMHPQIFAFLSLTTEASLSLFCKMQVNNQYQYMRRFLEEPLHNQVL